MAETKRLGVWGWFVRAFAAGFGAMCGMIAAAVVACAVSYALVAAGVLAFASLGGIKIDTSGTSTPVAPERTTTLAPAYSTTAQPAPHVAGPYAYPTTVQPAPHVAGPYANTGASYGGSYPHAAGSVQPYPASPGPSTFEQGDDDAPPADVQADPPLISIPSEPIPSLEDGSIEPRE